VEGLEATHNLNNDFPDVLLLNELLVVLAFADSLEYVAIVSVLHHDTERVRRFIEESFAVGCYKRVIDACQYTNLV